MRNCGSQWVIKYSPSLHVVENGLLVFKLCSAFARIAIGEILRVDLLWF